MAIYSREQVGSSFKPYVLAVAVPPGMNVQTSSLDGQDSLHPARQLPVSRKFHDQERLSGPGRVPEQLPVRLGPMSNDSTGENGAFKPQNAMANSVNTAFSDLWHYVGGAVVANMAKEFGVDTDAACITARCGTAKHPVPAMQHESGVALGQASLSVLEQATMLAAIDNGGSTTTRTSSDPSPRAACTTR